ncbi:hypothetical protein [Helicobacter jaachi]|nr:hypothetical protein [Helicobacter jaachi]
MQHIFSHLKQDYPLLAHKLLEQDELARFKNMCLTPLEKEQILFLTIKNEQLLFAFKHQALCAEFNHYKHKHIIETLRQHKQTFPTLSSIQKIRAYVPSHILKPKIELKSIQRYYEHSNGEFINLATDSIIFDKIEALRVSIKRQWDSQNEQ